MLSASCGKSLKVKAIKLPPFFLRLRKQQVHKKQIYVKVLGLIK